MGFTPSLIEAFLRTLMGRLVQDAMPVALEAIPSEQLRAKLVPRVHSPTRADLFLTPYWSLFLHDGHGVISPQGATFLVYYRNREDDPRRPGGKTPDRLADEKRLTAQQFAEGFAENRRRRQLNPGGGSHQFMIVVQDTSGRPANTGPARGIPFFEHTLMAFFEDHAEDTIYDLLNRFILREFADEAPDRTERPIRFEF